MKNLFLLTVVTLFATVSHAHPGLDYHAHDSLIGEWGWLLVPALIVFVVGMVISRKKVWAKVRVKK